MWSSSWARSTKIAILLIFFLGGGAQCVDTSRLSVQTLQQLDVKYTIFFFSTSEYLEGKGTKKMYDGAWQESRLVPTPADS